MIDREARLKLASALAAYMRGDIDNFELDDKVFESKPSADHVLEKLRTPIWFMYDDCKRHHVYATAEQWEMLRRLIAFLKSDLERPQVFAIHPASEMVQQKIVGVIALAVIVASAYLAWCYDPMALLLPGIIVGLPRGILTLIASNKRRNTPPRTPFYPFANVEQWKQFERLLGDLHLPEFDPAKHGRAIRSQFASRIMIVPSAIVMVFVVIPIAAAFGLLRRRSSPDAGSSAI